MRRKREENSLNKIRDARKKKNERERKNSLEIEKSVVVLCWVREREREAKIERGREGIVEGRRQSGRRTERERSLLYTLLHRCKRDGSRERRKVGVGEGEFSCRKFGAVTEINGARQCRLESPKRIPVTCFDSNIKGKSYFADFFDTVVLQILRLSNLLSSFYDKNAPGRR